MHIPDGGGTKWNPTESEASFLSVFTSMAEDPSWEPPPPPFLLQHTTDLLIETDWMTLCLKKQANPTSKTGFFNEFGRSLDERTRGDCRDSMLDREREGERERGRERAVKQGLICSCEKEERKSGKVRENLNVESSRSSRVTRTSYPLQSVPTVGSHVMHPWSTRPHRTLNSKIQCRLQNRLLRHHVRSCRPRWCVEI